MPLLGLCLLGRVRRHNSDHGFTRPATVSQTTWFSRLVGDHRLEAWLSTRQDAKTGPVDQSICEVLVNVRRGQKYEGPLTPWSQEEEMLWENLGRPHAVTSLNIDRCVVTQRPVTFQRPSQLKIPVWSPTVPASNVVLRGFAPPDTNQLLDEQGLCQALHVSDDELKGFLQAPVCLAIPGIFLQLIKKGVWATLMFCLKWHSRHRGLAYQSFAEQLHLKAMHQEMRAAGVLDTYVGPPNLPFSQSDALTLAKRLQEWATNILDRYSMDDDDFSTVQLFLEEVVLKLKTFGGSLCVAQHNRQKRLSHDSVVRALCTCLNLRNKSQLSPTILSAVAAFFPGMDADMHIEIPSGGSLSRRQLLVDAAYACYWRDLLLDHDGPLYLWADSSPQGGVDWLLSIVSLIGKDDLEAVAAATNCLQESTERFLCAYEVDDKEAMLRIASERHESGQLIAASMKLHRQIPMALGSGASSLDHKARCICRKMFAESQSVAGLKQQFARVRSMCTDMGTEQAIPEVEGASLESLLPEYMRERELFSEDVPLAEADATDAPAPGYLFPQALLAPGILHIIHNMTKEIDSSLPFFKPWLQGFKAVARMLHADHLRRRFVATCVRGTPFAWLADSFEKGVAKPAEWRWGTITAIVPHILSLRNALQATWSPGLFGQREDENRESEADRGEEGFNLDAVTEAVNSKKWWLQTEVVSQLNQFADEFSSWAEGCECHAWLRASNSAAPHARRQARLSPEAEELMFARRSLGLSLADGGDGVGHLCPIAGRRAPELACGAATQYFEQLGGSQLHQVRKAGLQIEADPADIQEVLENVAQCTAAMQAYVCQKLQCWDVLPWKLCGIAHSSDAKARRCASECLKLFCESPQQEHLHHRMTWEHLR